MTEYVSKSSADAQQLRCGVCALQGTDKPVRSATPKRGPNRTQETGTMRARCSTLTSLGTASRAACLAAKWFTLQGYTARRLQVPGIWSMTSSGSWQTVISRARGTWQCSSPQSSTRCALPCYQRFGRRGWTCLEKEQVFSTTQGFGAIGAVGAAAVHVANTLDTAMEQLFENWHAPVASPQSEDSSAEQTPRSHCGTAAGSPVPAAQTAHQPQHVPQLSRKSIRCELAMPALWLSASCV